MEYIVITGCPRSGTKFTAKYLSQLSLDIGHESFGKDGISSWCLASNDNNKIYGPSYEDLIREYPDCKIYHQTRDPLLVISSLTTILDKSWNFFSNYIEFGNDSILKKSMKVWYYWNKMAEYLTKNRYKVEEIDSIFKVKNSNVETNINSRDHINLTYKDLTKEDSILSYNIKIMAHNYGY